MFGSCLEDPLPAVIIGTLQIVNYVTNPIQFQVGTKIFIFILCFKSIGRYWLYLTNTDTTTQYHKNRLIPPILMLKFWFISSHVRCLFFSLFLDAELVLLTLIEQVANCFL